MGLGVCTILILDVPKVRGAVVFDAVLALCGCDVARTDRFLLFVSFVNVTIKQWPSGRVQVSFLGLGQTLRHHLSIFSRILFFSTVILPTGSGGGEGRISRGNRRNGGHRRLSGRAALYRSGSRRLRRSIVSSALLVVVRPFSPSHLCQTSGSAAGVLLVRRDAVPFYFSYG